MLFWFKTRLRIRSLEITDKELIERAIEQLTFFIVFFGKEDSMELRTWRRVCRHDTESKIIHAHSFDVGIAAEYGVEGTGIVVFKKYDERRNDYNGDLLNKEEILKFIQHSKS